MNKYDRPISSQYQTLPCTECTCDTAYRYILAACGAGRPIINDRIWRFVFHSLHWLHVELWHKTVHSGLKIL